MRVLNNLSASFPKEKDRKGKPQSVSPQIPPERVRNYLNRKVNFSVLVQDRSMKKKPISVLPPVPSTVWIHNHFALCGARDILELQ